MRFSAKQPLVWQRDRRVQALVLFSAVLGLALLVGCGGPSTTTTKAPPPVITVAVLPGDISVEQGATQQFSATVSGTSNQAVIWSTQEGSAGGTVSQTGLYSAPASAMDVHVVATSVADPSKSATALVRVSQVTVSLASV